MKAGARIRGRIAHRTGLAAEAIAERLYLREGGTVLARRWRAPQGEIDLIVALGGCLVFVEVKARRAGPAAAEALRPAQMRRIGAAIETYLAEHAVPGQEVRVDLVLVDRQGGAERIENALAFDGL